MVSKQVIQCKTHLTTSTARKYCYPVTPEEIMAILGLMFVFRGRKNITTLEYLYHIYCSLVRHQFEKGSEFYDQLPFDHRRYSLILSNLSAAWPQFFKLIRDAWHKAFITGANMAIDESIWGFHVSSESNQADSAPTRYIPRKPHPNGKKKTETEMIRSFINV